MLFYNICVLVFLKILCLIILFNEPSIMSEYWISCICVRLTYFNGKTLGTISDLKHNLLYYTIILSIMIFKHLMPGVRLYDGPNIKLFILIGWDQSFLSVALPTAVQLGFSFCSGFQ